MNATRLRRTVLNVFGQFVIVLAGVMGALWAQEIGEERMLTAPDSLMTGPTRSVDSLVYEGLFRLAAARGDIPAFEDLKSSGELSVIGSEALRIQLQKMDGARATVVRNTDALTRFQEELSRIVIRDDGALLAAFDSTLALIDRRLEELGR